MAGFWAGFGEQLTSNIEQRKKTLDRMIEENLANARTAKRDYSKRKGTADQVLKSAQAIRDKFGLSDAQALALTEGYGTDLPKLQAALDQENDKLKSNLGVSYTAEDVMSYVNAADQLTLPEGMTLNQGVERLMGLNYQELAKEANPKSEGSKTRSFIRAALAFDPQLQAAEQMQNIKGPGGMSYAQLLEMQEAGFAPEETYGDVTRAGGVTYDYTASTAGQTRTDYSRRLSTKVFDADLTDAVEFNSYMDSGTDDKSKLKASVLGAGEALARLEKDIVLTFRGTDLAMNAFRKSILDNIYARVDTAEELDTLKESVASGMALEIIESKGGRLTNEDIDAILLGDEDKKKAIGGEDSGSEDSGSEDSGSEDSGSEDSGSEDSGSEDSGSIDSEVTRMIEEQEGAEEEEPKRTNRRRKSGMNASRSETEDTTAEEPSDPTVDKIKSDSEFIETYFNDVLDFFEEIEVDRTNKKDIKLALADWFSDNAEKLDIPSSIRTEDMAEVIYKAFNE